MFSLVDRLKKVESRHILRFILTISIPGFAFLLAGCSSSHASLPNIYLISLSYQNLTLDSASGINKNLRSLFTSLVGDAQLTVRTGYFGFCISLKTEDWICRTSVAGLREHVNATQDPLNLIDMSMVFKDNIVFSGLLYDCSIDFDLILETTGFATRA